MEGRKRRIRKHLSQSVRALSNYAWKMSEGCRGGEGRRARRGRRGGGGEDGRGLCAAAAAEQPDAGVRFDTWQRDPSVHIRILLSEASCIIKRQTRGRGRGGKKTARKTAARSQGYCDNEEKTDEVDGRRLSQM